MHSQKDLKDGGLTHCFVKNDEQKYRFNAEIWRIRYEYSLDYVFLLSYTKRINFQPLCVAA